MIVLSKKNVKFTRKKNLFRKLVQKLQKIERKILQEKKQISYLVKST